MGTKRVNIKPEQTGIRYRVLADGVSDFMSVPADIPAGVLKKVRELEAGYVEAQKYLQGLSQRFGNMEVAIPEILMPAPVGRPPKKKKRAK